jgi:hypothetical protein
LTSLAAGLEAPPSDSQIRGMVRENGSEINAEYLVLGKLFKRRRKFLATLTG